MFNPHRNCVFILYTKIVQIVYNWYIQKLIAHHCSSLAVPCYTLIKKHSYKIHPDLTICKAKKKLESICIDLSLPKNSSIIVGCIYKHASMDICTFNSHYIIPLLVNLSKEQNKKYFQWEISILIS